MQRFSCQCGQPVFFENEQCVNCGSRLGFDPGTMCMLSLSPEEGQWRSPDGRAWQLCNNALQFGVCNWVLPSEQSHPLCFGCQFNRTVPDQSLPDNRQRWQLLEQAKKRLFYSLLQLRLPLQNGWEAPDRGLLLDFVEDERSHGIYAETFVHTGYLGGVITINVLEADDAAREAQRLQMNENYRTVLGHLRHESGHYYWQRLNPDPDTRGAFISIFGDETADYQQALDRYYAQGPVPDWRNRYISTYASAHPAEDWAESWGHYLHIYDALETAAAHGLTGQWPNEMDIAERIETWRTLSVTLNELNRSMGRSDAYPFVLNTSVELKLTFVDRVIGRLQTQR
ncbi:MAG: putative zinc-binding metallopeptidase [Halioglobus sp.]